MTEGRKDGKKGPRKDGTLRKEPCSLEGGAEVGFIVVHVPPV
jgi:hypothetical protein